MHGRFFLQNDPWLCSKSRLGETGRYIQPDVSYLGDEQDVPWILFDTEFSTDQTLCLFLPWAWLLKGVGACRQQSIRYPRIE